ncbi:hypothetical protein ACQKGC_05670 [Allorhizobium pseudoryzae]|uniref:hypothetical protein n=1 Tax=Allorhizobium pseudoryzae TaxID=379684 RepID=UPI003CFC6D74
MNITNAKEIPYFDRLPRYALPALQHAWDRAKFRTVGTHAIYIGFCRDMEFVGFEKPTKPIMNEWIGKVQQGLIDRPLATEEDKREEVAQASTAPAEPEPAEASPSIDGLEDAVAQSISDEAAKADPRLKGKAEALHRSRLDFLSPTAEAVVAVEPQLSKPFFSPDFPADITPIEPMAKDLKAISARMLDELVTEFEPTRAGMPPLWWLVSCVIWRPRWKGLPDGRPYFATHAVPGGHDGADPLGQHHARHPSPLGLQRAQSRPDRKNADLRRLRDRADHGRRHRSCGDGRMTDNRTTNWKDAHPTTVDDVQLVVDVIVSDADGRVVSDAEAINRLLEILHTHPDGEQLVSRALVLLLSFLGHEAREALDVRSVPSDVRRAFTAAQKELHKKLLKEKISNPASEPDTDPSAGASR